MAEQGQQNGPINKYNRTITQKPTAGAAQVQLYVTGVTDEDSAKAQVGITSLSNHNGYDGKPCNMHINDLGAKVKKGVNKAGLVGYQFNTIGVMSALWYDANSSIPGCDKNMPGCLMAMGCLNRPSTVIYGGTMKKGKGNLGSCSGRENDIGNALECNSELISGKINEEERRDIIRNACPCAGACGGMFTANAMS
ncbi:unnamed protein product [Umbelopsis sp. WA50703]